jgi:dsRNA-specific ribonuclease
MSTIIEMKYSNSSDKILRLEEILGLKFNKRQWAIQAITSISFSNDYNKKHKEIYNQNAIAILGDAILKSVISETLLKKERSITKGELTETKKMMECNETLYNIGLQLDVKDCLLVTDSEDLTVYKIATTIEAIIGAIYLSNGIRATKRFVMDKIISFVDVK